MNNFIWIYKVEHIQLKYEFSQNKRYLNFCDDVDVKKIGIGGAAHLVNFLGTDNIEGILSANRHCKKSGIFMQKY